MTREEEIINAAKTLGKKEGFSPIVNRARGVNSAWGIGFLEGAVWADKHPRSGLVDIEKVIEWIGDHIYIGFGFEDRMNELRKAMEGSQT